MSTMPRPRAALGVKRRNVPGVLFRAKAMHGGITANAVMFVAPPIDMPGFRALIDALAEAQQDARGTKATGSAKLRDTKRNDVWTAMESLRTYVQGLCDELSADDAGALIEAAGLVVAASTAAPAKALLTATLTATPGLVHLDANASLLVGRENAYKRPVFNWQMCSWGPDPAQPGPFAGESGRSEAGWGLVGGWCSPDCSPVAA
jgi:hypothetical protein